MRAFAVRKFGEPAAIHEMPKPEAQGTFLIRVTYAGVNPIDYKTIDRLTAASRFPLIVGADFAGVIERTPASERDLHVGDRVFGMAQSHGAYAQYTSLSPSGTTDPLARIPEGVPDEQAAALPIPGMTALQSLNLLEVSAGQHVVVIGATGGVGGFAVQMARARGAHVIATVRSDVDEARRLGAEEIYDSKTGDVLQAIHNSHPAGVDAVLDLINGPKEISRDAEILKPDGKLVSTIYAADESWFAQRKITAHNIVGKTNPLATPLGMTELARMLSAGTITARIRITVDLNDAPQVLDKLRHGELHGKAVIRI
jgi:NADPH2:quinone reductase